MFLKTLSLEYYSTRYQSKFDCKFEFNIFLNASVEIFFQSFEKINLHNEFFFIVWVVLLSTKLKR